ncbi:hypothetical protein RchiOBHm_Chr6g0277051 [Rosa chinensis]|uniref:Uncharacterized protein n=1 Tax=Rosa chinensis TaxID=74649 RepID=A0A2P6PSE4_ROSCH|nr:uncharacterized protein LOC112174372 isoform X2 [Rosa chinensis]PRQ24853.1 hypothetical protein RchiOBHm_Chr6g0277051 [Rosa chinensis]
MGSVTEEELVQMVTDFIESSESVPDSLSSPKSPRQSKSLTLQEIIWKATDHENEILDKISIYLRDLESMIHQPKNLKNKWVVMKLKMDGYEASLCKTSWVSSVKLPEDDYEYVDVMVKDNNLLKVTRLIVDMDFKSQFELARPSPSYKELKDILPDIFVGTEEKLDKVISLVCSAAQKSLKKMGLHVPPWRKAAYMQSKWLSKDCKKISISPTNMELGIISQMH